MLPSVTLTDPLCDVVGNTAGHADAHVPLHVDFDGESAVRMYSVWPFPLVRTLPTLVVLTPIPEPAVLPDPAGLVTGDPPAP